jgi:tRNA(fMet)-specific endonuclease VapC
VRRYLLDTNAVSHALRGHPRLIARLTSVPMASLCISAVTEGELAFGLARRPEAARLHALVEEFLRRVAVLPWDRACASRYGALRAALGDRGRALAPLDLLIAAHALAVDAVLVSNDRAFAHCDGLAREDWTV